MGSSPSKTSATAGSPTCFDYEAWVRQQLDIPADALILEKPESNTVARIEEARARNVGTIVCGFLPDEIEWPEAGWNATLGYFVERFRFRPLVLATPESEPKKVGNFVGISDQPDTAVEALTAACAAAAGLSAVNLVLNEVAGEQLVDAISHASLVINASTDWTCGFAVDELAVRFGASAKRLFNPGFSPLRFAVLKMDLPPRDDHAVARLRPLLRRHPREADARSVRLESSFMFGSNGPWRSLFGRDAQLRFWPDGSVVGGRQKGVSRKATWLDRTISWSGLAAFIKLPGISEEVLAILDRIIAQWVLYEQPERSGQSEFHRAVGRWIRFRPQWLKCFHEVAGDGREASRLARAWVVHSLAFSAAGTSKMAVMRALKSSVVARTGGETHGDWLLAWATSFRDVENMMELGVPLDPVLRGVCAGVYCEHVRDLALTDAVKNEERSAHLRLLSRSDLWSLHFGRAGTCLRFVGTLHARCRPQSFTAWRALTSELGLPVCGGLACVIRRIFDSSETFSDWISKVAAGLEGAEPAVILGRLSEKWYRKCAPELWRSNRNPEIDRELSFVLRVTASLDLLTARCYSAMIFIPALSGAAKLTLRSIRTIERAGLEQAFPMGLSGGLALWLGGDLRGAREVLDWFQGKTGASAYTLFLQALLAQITGDSRLADSILERLQLTFPEFFQDQSAADPRWIWVAVVFKLAGRSKETQRMCRVAKDRAPETNVAFYSDIPFGSISIATKWNDFLAENPNNTLSKSG